MRKRKEMTVKRSCDDFCQCYEKNCVSLAEHFANKDGSLQGTDKTSFSRIKPVDVYLNIQKASHFYSKKPVKTCRIMKATHFQRKIKSVEDLMK